MMRLMPAAVAAAASAEGGPVHDGGAYFRRDVLRGHVVPAPSATVTGGAMSAVMQVLRLVIGVALLAGGAVLAQPFASAVMAARQGGAPSGSGPASAPSQPQAMTAGVRPTPADAASPTAAWPAGFGQLPGFAGGVSASPPPVAEPPGFSYGHPGLEPNIAAAMPPSRSPPPPPAPLPRSVADGAPAPPGLDGAYRSTLDIPPPPLLDTQSPPPLAVGWSANDLPRPSPAVGDAAAPATYVVRDGDDLTGIALRVYGSAGAASAIWAANRDRLQDPQLLPIGLVLRMPPSWTLPSAHAAQGAGQAIEPTFGVAAPSAASWRTARPSSADQRGAGASVWLQTGDGAAGHVVAEPAREPPGPPTSVRVAPGDTLESIATRVYGDRTAAARLWQANKDRLRSPDLLVPGTELRLP
jgi:nucleoid-associated protein YgaU